MFDVFVAFCGGTAEMDGRAFVKCLREARLLDGQQLKVADADIIFAKHRAKGLRKIGYDEFEECLLDVAHRRCLEEGEVERLVCEARGPAGNASAPHPCGAGPERFFYDRSTWTGTHRNGGPTLIGGGLDDGDVVQDNNLVHRGFQLEDALHRKKLEGGVAQHPLPVLLGGHSVDRAPAGVQKPPGAGKDAGRGPGASAATSAGHGASAGASAGAGAAAAGARAASPGTSAEAQPRRGKSPVRGPERFFYDKSTYTGTWRNGGPTVLGSGLPKTAGYGDLKDLVTRGHVQDDALHRRRGEDGASVAVEPLGPPPVEPVAPPPVAYSQEAPQMHQPRQLLAPQVQLQQQPRRPVGPPQQPTLPPQAPQEHQPLAQWHWPPTQQQVPFAQPLPSQQSLSAQPAVPAEQNLREFSNLPQVPARAAAAPPAAWLLPPSTASPGHNARATLGSPSHATRATLGPAAAAPYPAPLPARFISAGVGQGGLSTCQVAAGGPVPRWPLARMTSA